MQQHRALILRSNRFLGSALVEHGLLSSTDLEAANGKFMQSIQTPELLKNASILTTLLYDLKVLDECKLLDYAVNACNVGLIDLNYIGLRSLRAMDVAASVDTSICWASWTIPFDRVEDTYMLASCYFMSAPVIKYWEDLLDGKVVWYGTSTASMTHGLERLEDIHAEEDALADAEEDALADEEESN